MKRRFLTAGGLVVTLALAGCATVQRIPPPVVELPPNPLVQRIPLTVGVYFSPEFRDHEESALLGKFFGRTVRSYLLLGPASVTLFEQALALMFDHVVTLTGETQGEEYAVDAVVEPSFASAYFATGIDSPEVLLRYLVELRRPAREPIASWAVEGRCRSGEWGSKRRTTRAAEVALRRAAADFLTSFREQPEIVQWLTDSGVLPADGGNPGQ